MFLILDLVYCANLNLDAHLECSIYKNSNDTSNTSTQEKFDNESHAEILKQNSNIDGLNYESANDLCGITNFIFENIINFNINNDYQDLNSLKEEMASTYLGKDYNDSLEIDDINIITIESQDEDTKSSQTTDKVGDIPQNTKSLAPDSSCYFFTVKERLSQCEEKIKTILNKGNLEKIILEKKNQNGINEKMIDKEIMKSYNKKLTKTRLHNRKLNVKNLRAYEKVLSEPWIPTDIKNIITDFIRIFNLFIEIFYINARLPKLKVGSVESRINIQNFNIKIFSQYKNIPILESFHLLEDKLETYEYKYVEIKYVLEQLITRIKTKLTTLILHYNETINILRGLNQLYYN
ncbi:uncharacterized protein VNE69_05213 [Vairimorpha necatrix]|uniref:Uncharacterized protein n=1 Tax=Vairimorpha necatrix TaxID=6039 RepID=A0AAX4JCE9_9MICR